MTLLVAGKVLGTHHLKGEVKVVSDMENIFLLEGEKVILELEDSQQKLFKINKVQPFIGNKWIFTFEGITNKKDAMEIRNALIKVRRDLLGISEDEYLLSDMVGIKVYDIEKKEYLGEITEIFETAAHNIYVVNSEEFEIMIPDVDAFIKNIDFNEKIMEVKLLDGMKEIKRK